MPFKILIVEDVDRYRLIYRNILGDGFEYAEADNMASGEAILKSFKPDIVLLDLFVDSRDSNDGLLKIKVFKKPSNKVVVISGIKDWHVFNQVINLGASEFIQKDANLTDNLKLRVGYIVQRLSNEKALEELFLKDIGYRYLPNEIIVGNSEIMKKLFLEIESISKSKEDVLITGQTGVGKELVARALHFKSPRKDKPFLAINAATIPEEVYGVTLFGCQKGAFTGAEKTTIGILEKANGSTLFVDHTQHLTPLQRGQLSRVLSAHEYRPVGSTKVKKIDIRFIFAINETPEELVRAGLMPQDFYFRINQLRIHMPNLQARKDDIPWLANHFIKEINQSLPPTEQFEFSREAIDHMVNHDWPGNVRELKNTIKRAVMDCTDRFIRPQQLNLSLMSNPSADSSHADPI